MISIQLKRLAKGAAIYGTGVVLNRFITLLLLPLFTAYLSPKEFGIIAILTMLSVLLSCIFSFGIGVSIGIYYFIGEETKQKADTIWMATFVLVLASFILLTIGVVGSEKIAFAALGSTEYRFLVILALVNTSLEISAQPSLAYLQFEEKSTQFVIISVVTTLITLGSSILFIAVLEKGLIGLMEAGVISRLMSFIIYFFIVVRSLKLSINLPLAKKLIRTGLPYVTGALCFFLIQYADRYMLEIFCGLKVVGIYSVGYSLGMVMILFVAAFSSAWTPYFNSFVNNQQEAKNLFGKVLEYYIMGMGVLCLCMFLFAMPVVVVMTTEPFYGAYSVVGLIALSQLLYGCYIIFLPGLYFAKKSGKVNLIIIVASCINIILNLILIPKWNMLGATFATVVSFLAMAVATHFTAKKYFVIHFDRLKIAKYSFWWGLSVILSYLIQGQTITRQILLAFFIISSFLCIVYFILDDREKFYFKKICHDIYGFGKLKWKKC